MTAKVTSNPQKTTSAPVRMHMSGNNRSVRGNYYFAKSLINNVRFSRHVQPIYTGADGRTVQTAHVRRTVLCRPLAWWAWSDDRDEKAVLARPCRPRLHTIIVLVERQLILNPQAYWWKVLANVAEFIHYAACGRQGRGERVRTMSEETTLSVGPNSNSERLRSVDGRTRLGRFMSELRAELYEALGTKTPTPMQRILVDRAVEKSARCILLSRQMLNGGEMSAENERRYIWHSNSLSSHSPGDAKPSAF